MSVFKEQVLKRCCSMKGSLLLFLLNVRKSADTAGSKFNRRGAEFEIILNQFGQNSPGHKKGN